MEAHGEIATYVSPSGGNPTLATRVGGQHVWGTFPYYEAALLGGVENVRGLREQRFAGRSSLYGSAEFRATIGRLFLLFPADFGVFGFGDLGRVFQDDLLVGRMAQILRRRDLDRTGPAGDDLTNIDGQRVNSERPYTLGSASPFSVVVAESEHRRNFWPEMSLASRTRLDSQTR